MNDYYIRGDFIRQYAEKHTAETQKRWKLINDRNEEHRALNIASGYSEPDGTFSIGCKSHADIEYKSQYDQIESDFRIIYDRITPDFESWLLENRISIFEVLFFDNIDHDHLKIIAGKSLEMDDWQLTPIFRRATLFVEKLGSEHLVGEIERRISIECQHFRYTAYRCRKFFSIRPWDIGRHKTIFCYGLEWKRALRKAFSSLSIEQGIASRSIV